MGCRFELKVIAETGNVFRDFAPYVPAISERGAIVFQARLEGDATGVFSGVGGIPVELAASSGSLAEILSHPDIDGAGNICFYGELADVGQRLFLNGDPVVAEAYASAGPLGPTMNESGAIAFRGMSPEGHPGVFLYRAGEVTPLADTRGDIAAFHGLPVLTGDGTVVFRADRSDGGQTIYACRGGELAEVAESGREFSGFEYFPSSSDNGTIVFVATLAEGGSGVFATVEGGIKKLVASDGLFESIRGAMINDAGTLVYYATPLGGRLGIYCDSARIAGIGDSFFGSTIAEFALNPVSFNNRGEIAVRIKLEDTRQMIVRVSLS